MQASDTHSNSKCGVPQTKACLAAWFDNDPKTETKCKVCVKDFGELSSKLACHEPNCWSEETVSIGEKSTHAIAIAVYKGPAADH